jgi:gluconokinase
MIVILMGVAGSGKTTVGQLLARRLGWPFYDADDFHPPANVEKMRRGVPLDDADRAPWLDALHALIARLAAEQRSAVVACSALTAAYRRHLAAGVAAVRLVYLRGSVALLRTRLAGRHSAPSPSPTERPTRFEPETPTHIDGCPKRLTRSKMTIADGGPQLFAKMLTGEHARAAVTPSRRHIWYAETWRRGGRARLLSLWPRPRGHAEVSPLSGKCLCRRKGARYLPVRSIADLRILSGESDQPLPFTAPRSTTLSLRHPSLHRPRPAPER